MNVWEWADRHPTTAGIAIFFGFLIVLAIIEAFSERRGLKP